MAEKTNGNVLIGFTTAETIVMAAAWYHARSVDVDFDNVAAHIGSKSAASIRERLRLCRKKEVQIEGIVFKDKATASPAGGVDKKAAGKVNASPRKAGGKANPKATPKKPKVAKETLDEDEDEVKEESETTDSPMEEA